MSRHLYCGKFSFFFFKQKTAYEMRISDWSSDVCSSDLSASRDCEAPFPAPLCGYQSMRASPASSPGAAKYNRDRDFATWTAARRPRTSMRDPDRKSVV